MTVLTSYFRNNTKNKNITCVTGSKLSKIGQKLRFGGFGGHLRPPRTHRRAINQHNSVTSRQNAWSGLLISLIQIEDIFTVLAPTGKLYEPLCHRGGGGGGIRITLLRITRIW